MKVDFGPDGHSYSHGRLRFHLPLSLKKQKLKKVTDALGSHTPGDVKEGPQSRAQKQPGLVGSGLGPTASPQAAGCSRRRSSEKREGDSVSGAARGRLGRSAGARIASRRAGWEAPGTFLQRWTRQPHGLQVWYQRTGTDGFSKLPPECPEASGDFLRSVGSLDVALGENGFGLFKGPALCRGFSRM